MKENIIGFLVIAGVIAWLLSKHSYLLKPLLFLGAAVFGILLFAFIVWYGLVQIRIFFRI